MTEKSFGGAGLEEREDRHMVHVHAFDTLTFVADNHQHGVKGVSGPARNMGASHVHRIRVRTSFFAEDGSGHWHWFDVMTGPAMFTMTGDHTHTFAGETSFDDGHVHEVENIVAQAPDIEAEGYEQAQALVNNKLKNKKNKRQEAGCGE